MGILIDNAEFERMARELADRRGISVDDALTELVRRELEQEGAFAPARELAGEDRRWPDGTEIARRQAAIRDIQARIAAAPVLDPRPYREVLYDEDGLPR